MCLTRATSAHVIAALFAGSMLISAQSGVPAAPTDLTATVSGTTVIITWLPGGGPPATGYQVEAALTSFGAAVATLPVTSPTLTVTSVPNGTYFVRVRATNELGVSAASGEVVVTVGTPACATAPNPPENLTHTVDGGVVSFNWAPSAGGCAPEHYVLSAGSATGLSNLANVNVGQQTTFTTPAPPGTYFVRVAGVNAYGVGPASNEVVLSVGPTCSLPGAPQDFSAGSVGTFASFQWQPPSAGGPPTSYLLEAGASPSGAELAVLPVSGLTFGTAAPPGSYYVRVRAQNACGIGPASSTQLLTIRCTPPGAPGTPSAGVTGTSVSLGWAGVAGATQYRVEVGTAAGASNVGVQTVSGTTTLFSGLAPGTYFTRVIAVNSCGPGAASGEATFTVASLPGASRVIGLSGNLAFGNVPVGQSATATLTISNTGNSTLTFTGFTCTCNVSVYSVSLTGGTVPPGSSRTVTVTFSPLSVASYTGTLSVISDATAGSGSIGISGNGISTPAAAAYHVWGGPNYTQYLGFWTCTFCQEFGANSINNTFGTYGSEYSSTSIRNSYSQYGSPYSAYSACNEYASTPPRVYNSDKSQYFGTLTLNSYAFQAITAPGIVSWLRNDVCQ